MSVYKSKQNVSLISGRVCCLYVCVAAAHPINYGVCGCLACPAFVQQPLPHRSATYISHTVLHHTNHTTAAVISHHLHPSNCCHHAHVVHTLIGRGSTTTTALNSISAPQRNSCTVHNTLPSPHSLPLHHSSDHSRCASALALPAPFPAFFCFPPLSSFSRCCHSCCRPRARASIAPSRLLSSASSVSPPPSSSPVSHAATHTQPATSVGGIVRLLLVEPRREQTAPISQAIVPSFVHAPPSARSAQRIRRFVACSCSSLPMEHSPNSTAGTYLPCVCCCYV